MSQSSNFAAHFPLPKSLARSSPPARPIESGSASPKRVAWRSALPIAGCPVPVPQFPAARGLPSAFDKTGSTAWSFSLLLHPAVSQLHTTLGRSYFFLGLLGSSLDDSMH